MSFESYMISHEGDFFPVLYQSVRFEHFSKGRQLAVLHRSEDGHMPLVRTTTVYQTPSQPFVPIHETIINKIREASSIEDLRLNNAMLEIYDSRYTTMGFHTDQTLDLEPNSYICLFSCYEKGADSHPRLLTLKSKESGDEWEVQLLHNSAVVFSTATNQQHLHKIEGKGLPEGYDNRWMGFTLRLSKSFVHFQDGVPCLVSNRSELGELTLATDEERKAFYRYKGRENREIDFAYPEIRYTISPSDRIPATP